MSLVKIVPQTTRAVRGKPLPASLWRFVWQASARHQAGLCGVSISVFLLSAAPLEIQRRLVNEALQGADFRPILLLAGAYLGLAIAEGSLKLAMNLYRSWVSEAAVREIRLVVGGLQHRRATDILGIRSSMMLAEAEPVGGFVGVAVSEPLLQGGLLLAVLGYMAILQPVMALVALGVFWPQVIVVPLLQRAINRRVALRINAMRSVSSELLVLSDDPGNNDHALCEEIATIFTLNMGIYKLKFTMNFLMNTLNHMGIAGILAVGGWFVVRGQTEVGTVVVFLSGLAKLNDPWGDLVNWFRDLTATSTKYRLLAGGTNAESGKGPRTGP